MPGDPAPTPSPRKHETLFEPRFLHLAIFPFLPIATLLAIGFLLLIPGIPPYAIIALAAATPFVGSILRLYHIHKARRTLRTYGRFLCLSCHYPLKGLPDEGVCPECEHPYDRLTTERRWLTWEESVNKGKPLA